MKILVIGSGGREHALAWKLAQSHEVESVYVAPGNAGAYSGKITSVPGMTEIGQLLNFARTQQIDLSVVGPEQALADGIVDRFEQHGLKIFGPNQQAAQLETSKYYAKTFMQRHQIPTAKFELFDNAEAAHAYVRQVGAPVVVKANGLAAGKGVCVAMTEDEAHQAIQDTLTERRFGEAGAAIVIEQCLTGEEVSFIVMTDGDHVIPLASSQDHKRIGDGDTGDNTGGMGAYSPAPIVTDALHEQIMAEVIEPTVRGLKADGIKYQGFLYAGLIIGDDGSINVLEYNCRLGDPEAQPLLMRLDSDLYQLIDHAIDGTLNQAHVAWNAQSAIGVVLASAGYPQNPSSGEEITGLEQFVKRSDVHIFQAGMMLSIDQRLVTTGGRVLCVTALGDTLAQAKQSAYDVIGTNGIYFKGMQYRKDIADRGIRHLTNKA